MSGAGWRGRSLQGTLFVLHTGIAWEHLPQELGFGAGMTYWRRLAERTAAGVWPRLHEVLLAELRSANALDFSLRSKIWGRRAELVRRPQTCADWRTERSRRVRAVRGQRPAR
jgi:transposase